MGAFGQAGWLPGNGDCKTDPKGWHPHTTSFEECVALITAGNCTMASYVSWGVTNPGPFESTCGWYSTCDFANLCKNCSTDTGPSCPTTKCPAALSNWTSMVMAPWKPPAPG